MTGERAKFSPENLFYQPSVKVWGIYLISSEFWLSQSLNSEGGLFHMTVKMSKDTLEKKVCQIGIRKLYLNSWYIL